MGIKEILFYLVAAGIVGMSLGVMFSGNIVRSTFSLLGVMAGIAGLYGILGVDYLAVVQVMIYVGGIMVLFLFAVMFTSKIQDINATNRHLGRIPAALLCVGVFAILATVIWTFPFQTTVQADAPTTAPLGKLLLGDYMVPFLALGVMVIMVLVGAVSLARPRKGENS